jgi:D-3-phosphoglycerate dehydrogenase
MLVLIDQFRSRFEEAGIELVAPKVVQVLSEDELIELLPACDGWIAGDDPASARVLAAGVAGKLRGLIKWGVGTDAVDFAAARELGLPVAHTPQVFGREVADVAMCYVIGLARQTFLIDREIRVNKAWPKPSGISLAGKKVALVGAGDIGKNVGRRLAASDMDIVAYDPMFTPSADHPYETAVWPDRLGEADFMVFTCPLNASTRKMLNKETLALAKPGVRIVNVARGPVFDEQALIEGLQSGHVHSAALDVFEIEPMPEDSPLRQFDRCIFGSHNGSNTSDAVVRVTHLAIDKLFAMLGVGEAVPA